jgi:hypothetical protein
MAVNTIKSLTERILRVINLGDVPSDSRFSLRDLEYMVRDALGKQILGVWYEMRKAGEGKDISDSFISTIKMDVQADSRNPINCYVDLLFDWVEFPDEGGIQSVRPAIQGTLPDLSAFIPTPARFNDIYRGLPAGALEGQIGWSLRGKQIIFSRRANQTLIELGVTSVEVDAVTTSEVALGQEKPLPIPPNVAFAICMEVAQFFMPLTQQQKDMLNDANPNLKPIAP